MKTILILFSGHGSNLLNLIDKFSNKYKITAITNNINANGINICKTHNIKCTIIDSKKFNNPKDYGDLLLKEILKSKSDLIVLAGYMKILSKTTLDSIKNTKMINLHPSLLPRHKGLNAIEKSYNDEYEDAGVSVHYVSHELDSGTIILQLSIMKKDYNNFESFKNAIKELEHQILPQAIESL